MKSIILASQSPRRKQLLEQAGVAFNIVPAHIDETPYLSYPPSDAVKASAQAKADQVCNQFPEHWVIAADTIVVINNNILGKPESKNHARKMLQTLSGKAHIVFTGFSICCLEQNKNITDIVKTSVQFKQLCDDEIEWYLQTDEPYDKAGAYAIQGIGAFIVKSIDGSYTNVVGLPVCEVMDILMKQNIIKRKSNEY
jgi:septum formation protein